MEEKNLLNDMPHAYKRKGLADNFDKVCTSINNDVVPSINAMIDYVKSNNVTMDDIKDISAFIMMSGIKANSPEKLFKSLSVTVNKMLDKQKDLNKFMIKVLPDIITKDNLSVKQLALIELLNAYNIVCSYTTDLLIYVTEILKKNLYGEHMTMPNGKKSEIIKAMPKYGMTINYLYHNVDRVVVEINNMDNTLINPEGKDKGILASISKVKNFLNPSSFIGNPIYYVQMWLVDFQLYRYEVYSDKRNMLQLKIQELESMKNGENNSKINKRIEYYNEKLEKTEYKIRELDIE